MTSTTSARRTFRLALVAVLAGLLLGSAPSLTWAAGTGGIEVTPVPGVRDGKPVTTFRVEVPREGSVEVPFLLSNLTDQPRTARLYAAQVSNSGGNFSLGSGSSPYVRMPDRQVTLAPKESREESFTVAPADGEVPEDEVFAAVVVEVRNGAVVQRANTLIYLRPARALPLPLLLLAVAVALLALAGAAVAVVARRRG